jgi:hypothetical protein
MVRAFVPDLGNIYKTTSEKARRILGWQPRTSEDSIIASANSLIELGVAGKRSPQPDARRGATAVMTRCHRTSPPASRQRFQRKTGKPVWFPHEHLAPCRIPAGSGGDGCRLPGAAAGPMRRPS